MKYDIMNWNECTKKFIRKVEVDKERIKSIIKNGLRSKNHQCLISYFYKERPEYEQEVYLISQMSYFRNRLEYYGENIPREFYEKNRDDFERIITLIKALIGDID